jgi:hypothetical protein
MSEKIETYSMTPQKELNLKLKQVKDIVNEICVSYEFNPYDVFEFIWENFGDDLDIELMCDELNS